MNICILDDNDPEDQRFAYAPEYYLKGHTWEKCFLKKETAVLQIKELAEKKFDVFLNLCDGAWDEPRPGIEVVQALAKYNLAFTGADQYFYEPTRESMKLVCEVNGLGFPRGIQVSTEEEIQDVLEHLSFPLLVKHPNSYASVGLTPQSKVENEQELRKQVSINKKRFGAALVEEFIVGTEYSVLVAQNPENYNEPVVFTPIEIVFADGETFKHEALKWVDYNKISVKPVLNAELRKELENMAQKLFCGLHGTGYGRCDIRRDSHGKLYLLEINPNGAVLYPPDDPGTADHILAVDPRGHKLFMELILKSAIVERENRSKGWEIKYFPTTGFGLYATRSYRIGDEILSLENYPHTLITKGTLDTLTEQERAKIFSSAFHLSNDIFYAPSARPEEWHPINHSCEPTMWFKPETMILVARTSIRKGDPLTIEYGTLFTEELPSFICPCESKNCRGRITGEDYKLPIMKQYQGHKTIYIDNGVQDQNQSLSTRLNWD